MRRYKVTVSKVGTGERETFVVEGERPGIAETNVMAITSIRFRGERAEYQTQETTEEVSPEWSAFLAKVGN